MSVQNQLKRYVGSSVVIRGNTFTLESAEEEHLVLMDEDHLHSFIQLTSIREVREFPEKPPEIILI